ncbi:hypothetical protein AB0I81_30195 [Nonomuraea sp. NPDC050404]|uniref:hypothetical protein n=1 Tax=Nonomuraea sp. NPDC050404 TaxID=3155783 RepID=UPI0034071469
MTSNPGRLPPTDQRVAAQEALRKAAVAYYKAIEGPTRQFQEALLAASGSPVDVPGSEKKSLVTLRQMVEITKQADPSGEGFTLYTIRKVVSELAGKSAEE